MNLNRVFILGRLTADPQLRTTTGGQPVASFGLATNRVWTDKNGQKQEAVEFHNVVLWGRQAEIASQFLTKGSLAFIEGRLQTRSWNDKDGQKKWKTEVIAERLQLGPKPQGQGGQRFESAPKEAVPAKAEEVPVIQVEEEIPKEDLPF